MFKNLLQFWKGKDFLNQVFDDFRKMLDDAENMFSSVCKKLIHKQEVPDLKNKIYAVDRQVNGLEKDIRKRVVEHLSLQPSADAPICLVLMSVVKDAERLGDYSKNLLEVSELLSEPINKDRYLSLFDGIEEDIVDLFQRTRKAFIESDQEEAQKSWPHERKIAKRCDEIIKKIVESSLSTNEAVCFSLMARYFKRIAVHLTNIATSVILPLADLDYFDEKRKDE